MQGHEKQGGVFEEPDVPNLLKKEQDKKKQLERMSPLQKFIIGTLGIGAATAATKLIDAPEQKLNLSIPFFDEFGRPLFRSNQEHGELVSDEISDSELFDYVMAPDDD